MSRMQEQISESRHVDVVYAQGDFQFLNLTSVF